MANGGFKTMLVFFALALAASVPHAQTTPTTGKSDLELVQKLISIRRDYQKTLEQLRVHYYNVQDLERMRWAEEELRHFHRIPKHAFILDLDVPPPTLNGNQNVPEANKLITWALQYKDKGWGTDYVDNQRRAELILQEILTKYPNSNRIDEVAFMLGDVYESKAYRQYYRAAEYYMRSVQWNPKSRSEARIRAARIYDKQLNNRAKAIQMYREVINHETDARRTQEAQVRLNELSGTK